MQIALKTLPSFAEADIYNLAKETTQLQVAGIKTFFSRTVDKAQECMSVANAESMVDTIAEKVIEKLRNTSFDIPADKDGGNESANFLGYQRRGRKGLGNKSNRGDFRKLTHQQGGNNPRNPGRPQSGRTCRSCESPDHFYRQCPLRFCQACGNKGHNAWNSTCNKYK